MVEINRRQSVAERTYRIVDPFHIERDETTHLKPVFVSNQIRTSKYTWLNFLPICLLQEFKRSANLYFLAIAILQSIKLISPLTPVTAIAPLVMVVSISLLREAIEDQKRRQSDRMINGKPVVVFRNFEERCVMWESIEVGDILRVSEREAIPADGIILSSSEDDGSCFIDTSNLDGEANLKSRQALKATMDFLFEPSDRDKTRYFVKCEEPDQDLYRFSGNISIDSKLYSLSEKLFLLRGSTLMNTKWIHLLVVYTGHETKIMKNARDPHHKMSHVDTMMSKAVVLVFFWEVILCALASMLHRLRHNHNHWYFVDSDREILDGVLLFLSFVVLMNTLIPISLVVTVELVKGAHAKFISWDDRMRSGNGAGAIANTSSLTDELGQVKYIFTDKTGTLTMNQMEFRKCSVGGIIYGIQDRKVDANSVNSPRPVSISSLDLMTRQAASMRHDSFPRIETVIGNMKSIAAFKAYLRNLEYPESRLALAMAICNTVVCEADPSAAMGGGDIRYNSDSPDECALVRGAIHMGVKLLARNGQDMFLSLTQEGREKSYLKTVTYTVSYEILRVLQFSSDRKRMSIIIRDADNHIKLICKGADSIILDRCDTFLSPRSTTMEHVTAFAAEGLRILLFAERELDEKYYESWEARYHEAELDMHSKELKTEMLMEEIESKLTLIGSSAVEDKLQEGVPETISLFQKAGIKIWVLTGDKLETSLEMGRLCRVVTSGMKEVVLQAATRDEMAEKLDIALKDARENQALVIEGASLTCALTSVNRAKFLQLALKSTTVIVCRTSPLQKALVVEMVKSGVPYVTLAVGDGANDVSMIRSAHVGVGVMGQEGMQAVRSADYAVQQFSHLGRLLLLHGRLSYMRTSQCINYFFYKNIVFTLPQFIYGVMSAHSGQTFFCDLYITAYNVLFTAMPVIVRAIMETDLPERIAETFPELYRSGAHNEYFSLGTLAKSSAVATFHAMVLTIIPMLLFQTGNLIGKQGPSGDIWMGSVASFFYIVPIVHFQIFYETWNWNKVVSTTYVASLALFFIAIAVYDNFTSAIEGVWRTVIVTPVFWLGFALSTALCLIPWLAYQAYGENFVTTNPVHILRRARFSNKIFDACQVISQREPVGPTGSSELKSRR